jgi:hypothetical protein
MLVSKMRCSVLFCFLNRSYGHSNLEKQSNFFIFLCFMIAEICCSFGNDKLLLVFVMHCLNMPLFREVNNCYQWRFRYISACELETDSLIILPLIVPKTGRGMLQF